MPSASISKVIVIKTKIKPDVARLPGTGLLGEDVVIALCGRKFV
jgi:hypothetical protein